MAVVLLAFAGLLAVMGAGTYLAPGPRAARGASTEVVLPQGAGVTRIASTLYRAGVIRSRVVFALAAEATGAAPRLKAGDYVFGSRASMAEILRKIRLGLVARRFVTIPEGFSWLQAAQVLARNDELTGSLEAAPEGSILPETYEVRHGESRAALVRRMQAAQADLLAQLWADRAPGLPYRTPYEAVILASIVEKETARTDERPHIAAVFLNRLRQGMRLGSDPTVIYGLTGGVPLGHGLRVSELAKRTAFNTYEIAGLPPTPIANPGKAALVAALHPLKTDDLYFVADGTGGHVFAATLAEHTRNVVKWRAIEKARAQGEPPP